MALYKTFDELWMERELATMKEHIIPNYDAEEESAKEVETDNVNAYLAYLASLADSSNVPTISVKEITQTNTGNLSVKAKARKHYHASMQEGRYHNDENRRSGRTYYEWEKRNRRFKEKVAFKNSISDYITEYEDEEEERIQMRLQAEAYDEDLQNYAYPSTWDKAYSRGQKNVLATLAKVGVKFTVNGLGEVDYETICRLARQM